jgi:acetyltransferase-like isoleucine patch superfamily enzyme
MADAGLIVERGVPTSGRRLLKPIGSLLADLFAAPALLLWFLSAALLRDRRDELFQGFSQGMSLLPGITGNFVRRAFYRRTLRRCSSDCQIGFGTLFATREVEIGDNVYIGPRCMIAHARIGNDVLIGSNVDILAGRGQHDFTDPDTPIRLQAGRYEEISIGRDVWLGNGCTVMADVGEGAVVAAAAVVVKPVAERMIVGGNPAREIGRRERADRVDAAR